MTTVLYVCPSRESTSSPFLLSELKEFSLLLDPKISLDDDSVIWLLLELAELLGLSCELQDCVVVELERLDEEFSILSM